MCAHDSHTHSHTDAAFINANSLLENEELASVTWIFLSTLTSNNLSHYSPRHQRGQTHQQLNWLICGFFSFLIKLSAFYKSHLLGNGSTLPLTISEVSFSLLTPFQNSLTHALQSLMDPLWSGPFSLLSVGFKFTFLINPLPLWHILVEDLFIIPIKYKLLYSSQGTQTNLQNSAILGGPSYQ